MYIDTSILIPTHNRLRNPELVETFLGDLNFLDKAIESKEDRINIGEIEGSLYIFNSHHRIVAANIAYGKIRESYLNIKSYTLDEMLTVNLDIGWVTPFDPHFFCRIPDFKLLKSEMLSRANIAKPEYREEFIMNESRELIEPRIVQTLGELYHV